MAVVWSIVGGEDKGGILVREGLDLSTPKLPHRLATGALVRELELLYVPVAGERLHYRLLRGQGPEEGWISVALNHKTLAERSPQLSGEEIEELCSGAPGLPPKAEPLAREGGELVAEEAGESAVSEDSRSTTAAGTETTGTPPPDVENGVRRDFGGDAGDRPSPTTSCSSLTSCRQAPQADVAEVLDGPLDGHPPGGQGRPEPEHVAGQSEEAADAPAEETQDVSHTPAAEEVAEAAVQEFQVMQQEASSAKVERAREILLAMEESATLRARLEAVEGCELLPWHIVGGEEKGGVLVREGLELSSAKTSERLSTGSLVHEVELCNERLHFLKLCGTGPDEGWLSIALDHKVLAMRAAESLEQAEASAERKEEEAEEEQEELPVFETIEDRVKRAEAEVRAEAWRRFCEKEEREAEQRREEERQQAKRQEESAKAKRDAARKAKEERVKKADLAWRVAEVRRIASEAKEKSCKSSSDRVKPRRLPQRQAPARRGGRGGRSTMALCDGALLDDDGADDDAADEKEAWERRRRRAPPDMDGDWECYCDMQKQGDLVKVFMSIRGSEGSYYTQSKSNRVNKLSRIKVYAEEKPVTVSFRWATWNGLAGEGTWRLSRSCDRVDGGWLQDGATGGPWLWTGARANQPVLVPPLPARAPLWYSIRVSRYTPRFQASMKDCGLEVVTDVLDDDGLTNCLVQARMLSKDAFPRRPFMQPDAAGNRLLAMLVSHWPSTRLLGYCIFAWFGRQEVQIEQLAGNDLVPMIEVPGMLLEWAVLRAQALGCEVVRMKGSNCSASFADVQQFEPRVHAPLSLLSPEHVMPSHLVVTGGLAELRELQAIASPVVAHLPIGTPVEVFQGQPARRGHQDVVKLRWPVVGWVSADLLRPQEAEEAADEKGQTGARLLEAMATVRSTVTGPDPFSKCFISSQALCDDLQDHKVFPKGSCTVVFGSFRKFFDDTPWWRHTWLRLGDGTIADITADQFDEALPRLWWPADASRYRPDDRKS